MNSRKGSMHACMELLQIGQVGAAAIDKHSDHSK